MSEFRGLNEFGEDLHRIRKLERRIADLEVSQNQNTERIQTIIETPLPQQTVAHQNLLQNADFDMSRNDFLYPFDVTDTEGEDSDVSEECYGWYVSPKNTAVESTGAVEAGVSTVTIDDPLFIPDDEGIEIIIEGAGTGGEDFLTLTDARVSPTQMNLNDPPVNTVENARVRWRLLTLVEDSTDEDDDADQETNTTLKNADHSLYPTTLNDPDWDKTNGYVRVGSDNWLCHPLKQNVIRPSVQYISSLIYRLSESIGDANEVNVNLFFGIWDNSPLKRGFLESEPIEINAEVQGDPEDTTETDYLLIFRTNWGETIGSEIVTVDAPTVYTNTEYVGLSWNQPAGIIGIDIYRRRGSSVVRLNRPYPQSSYRDKGAILVSGLDEFPSFDRKRSIAYMETSTVNFAPATTAAWVQAKVNIPVPSTYDAGKTTDKQWFVMGLVSEIEDGERALWIDRISLDDKQGIFSRSPWDAAAVRNISSAPPNGDIGGFGGSILPGDTDYCPTFDMGIDVWDVEGQHHVTVRAIDLVDNEDVYRIVNIDGEEVEYEASVSPTKQICYEMTAAGRKMVASLQHPVIADYDGRYILLKNIESNDIVLGKEGLIEVESNLRLLKPRHTVKISLKGQQKGYWINGIAGHNQKPSPIGDLIV